MTDRKYFLIYVVGGFILTVLLAYSVLHSSREPILILKQRTFEVERQEFQNFDGYIGVSVWLKFGIAPRPIINGSKEYSAETTSEEFCTSLLDFIPEVIAPQYSLDQLAWVKLYPPRTRSESVVYEPAFISFDGDTCRLPDQFALPAPQSNWMFYGSSPEGYAAKAVRNGFPETEIRPITLLFTWEGEGDIDYNSFNFQQACEVVIAYSPFWIDKNIERYHVVTFTIAITQLLEGVDPDQLPYAERQFLATDSGCEAIEMEDA